MGKNDSYPMPYVTYYAINCEEGCNIYNCVPGSVTQ